MLSAILADDYLGIDSLGRITNKQEELKGIRPANGYSFAAIDLDEVEVRSYGETIVVTGRSTVRLRHADQILIRKFRYTHVYVRQWVAGKSSSRKLRSRLNERLKHQLGRTEKSHHDVIVN